MRLYVHFNEISLQVIADHNLGAFLPVPLIQKLVIELETLVEVGSRLLYLLQFDAFAVFYGSIQQKLLFFELIFYLCHRKGNQ
jgi:hypothetical protein